MTAPTSKSREPIAPARDRTAKPIDIIRSVGAATVLASLPAPIHFGDWVIRHREFALVRVEGESGNVGYSFSLTRDGPVGAIIRRSVAPKYIGRPVDEREALFEAALSSNVATLSTGVGFRALSLVDLAAWDLAAQVRDEAGVTRPEYVLKPSELHAERSDESSRRAHVAEEPSRVHREDDIVRDRRCGPNALACEVVVSGDWQLEPTPTAPVQIFDLSCDSASVDRWRVADDGRGRH